MGFDIHSIMIHHLIHSSISFRSDVPPDVLTFTITLYNKGKRSKDTEVAELTVDLNTLTNGDEVIISIGEKKN